MKDQKSGEKIIPLVRARELSAGYGGKKVIEDVSFDVFPGEIVGILGANGSGKSTLVKSLCGILPHGGEVFIEGQSAGKLSPREISRLINYVPQKSGIGIDIPVMDVVMMGFNPELGLFENPGKEQRKRAESILDLVGLSDQKNSNYMTLSEGQKQLVILARAFAGPGRVFIADEPEGALDFAMRYRMMGLIKSRVKEDGFGAMMILHDTMLALNNCDRLMLVGEKKILERVDVRKEDVKSIEKKLKRVYGNISLVKTCDEGGRENLVMIYGPEDV